MLLTADIVTIFQPCYHQVWVITGIQSASTDDRYNIYWIHHSVDTSNGARISLVPLRSSGQAQVALAYIKKRVKKTSLLSVCLNLFSRSTHLLCKTSGNLESRKG